MNDRIDAFDQLGAFGRRDAGGSGDGSIVDRGFARALRRRVERALDAPSTVRRFDLAGPARSVVAAPSASSEPIATTSAHSEGNQTMPSTQVITPYLCIHDAAAAIEWYREFFAAEIRNVIPWEGRIGHAEVDVAGAVFYMSDEAHELGVRAPERDGSHTSVSIVLQVAAIDQFVERAVRGGAVVQRPIEESHGSRNCWFTDPFGHRWNVGTPTYDKAAIAERVAPAEPYYMTVTSPDVERAAAFFGAVLRWEYSEPNQIGGRHVENTEMPIGIRPPDSQFGTTEPGQIEMWWTVRDFDDALERVRVAGGAVVSVNAYDSGREAICEDDQGITFKFSEPAPGYDR